MKTTLFLLLPTLLLAADPPTELQLLQQQIDLLTKQKALAEAETALAKAQQAALLQKFIGTIPDSPIKGETRLGTNAGEGEVKTLGYQLNACLAVDLVAALLKAQPQLAKSEPLLLLEPDKAPTFSAWITFETSRSVVTASAARAIALSEGLGGCKPPDPGIINTAFASALIGPGLDAVAKILDFFRTDFAFANVSITPNSYALQLNVAKALRAQNFEKVFLPSVYSPAVVKTFESELLPLLGKLGQTRLELVYRSECHAKAAAADATKKDAHLTAKAALDAAVGLTDTFLASLAAKNATTNIPLITDVARDLYLRNELGLSAAPTARGYLLAIKAEHQGGSTLIKKSLLTNLGAMPLYYSGSGAVSYALFAGADGQVMASGTVTDSTNFVKAGKFAQPGVVVVCRPGQPK